MYDEILNKKFLLDELRKGGEIDEVRFEQEWEKIKNLFSLSFLQAVMEHLTPEEQTNISKGLDRNNPNDIPTLLERILNHTASNPDKIDKESCTKAAVTRTYNYYFDSLQPQTT